MSERVKEFLLPTANSSAPRTDEEKQSIINNAANAYEAYLDALGFDWRNDPNSNDTPMRVAKAWVNDIAEGCYNNEPKITAQPTTLKESIIEPFKEFFNRYQVEKNDIQKYVPYLILLFVLLYKVGDTMAHSLSTNFYLEIGFSKTEIGTVVKFFGLGATLIGAFVGGVLSLKIGLYKSLIYFGVFQLIATLGFAVLFYTGDNIVMLIGVITLENLAAGMGYTAYLAFIANMTSKQFTATQFALMTALMSLPRTFLSGTSGFLVEILDWDMYFIFCSLIAIPALLILKKIRFIIKDE